MTRRRVLFSGAVVLAAAVTAGVAVMVTDDGIQTPDCVPPPFDREAKPRGWPVYACGQKPRILVAHVENGMQALFHGPFTYLRDTDCLEVQPDTPVVWPPGTRPLRDGDRMGVDVPGLGRLWEGERWKSAGGNSPLSSVVGLAPDEPCVPKDNGPGEVLLSLLAMDR